MKTSIVTATFNRALQLSRGLYTLLIQPEIDEIVIVDDGSTDNTQEVVNNYQKMAKKKGIELVYIYLDHPEHRISSIPRNVGIKNSTGDLVVFTEPEVLHVGNTITQIKSKLKSNPRNVILASQIWTIQELVYKSLEERHFRKPISILGHPYAQLTTSTNLENTKAPNSDWAITGQKNCVAGCLFAAKRKWLMDIGGFDESFLGHGWHDFDLYERIKLYGKPMKSFDDIIVIHQWHEKNYPYNIYQCAHDNGKISEERVKQGVYKVNEDIEWGQIS